MDFRKHSIKITIGAAGVLALISIIWIIGNLTSSDITGSAVGIPGNIEIINDENYYPGVSNLINNAQESIHIAIFGGTYYEDPKEGNTDVGKLYDDLGAAVKRGVEVEIVFDQGWNKITETAIELKSRGIKVSFDTKERTTHAKFWVIDGKIVVIGSTNWSHAALQKNHEANIIIYSEELASEYEDYFEDIQDGN